MAFKLDNSKKNQLKQWINRNNKLIKREKMVIKKKTSTRKKTKTKAKNFNYKYLVIVESPAKSKTIEKYLGKGYKVLSSMGHLRDLPKSKLGVDVENNFEPYYIIIKGKTKFVNELKEYAQHAEKVFLAPDPDREGEAIAWHLTYALDLAPEKYSRIEFNEITKKAVLSSFDNAREIDLNRVNAQQARRCLDRLVGYKISPILWKKVKRGLSAGRVQSAAMRIICDREEAIGQFNPEEYWSIEVNYQTSKQELLTAKVFNKKEKVPNFKINSADEATEIEKNITTSEAIVSNVIKKERRRNPVAPFITSTLQQEAARRHYFNAKKTMFVAQRLYEGIDIGEESPVGLISYMRTDSTRISDSSLAELKDFISNNFDPEYHIKEFRTFKQRKSSQDAHEAIRPTSVLHEPEKIKQYLDDDQYKIYKLIWLRFVSSQMPEAVYDQTAIEITAGDYLLKATGSIIKFPGFLKLYEEQQDEQNNNSNENENKILPDISEQEKLQTEKISPLQHFTQPPARYTEASLVKELEEKGIGRPSTYAPIISTILYRNYVVREGKSLTPSELGKIVNIQLTKHFQEIVDIGFTAGMEEKLDAVAEGTIDWKKMLAEFYGGFEKELIAAETDMEEMRPPEIEAGEDCEKCGKPMMIKSGRFGDFMACSGFPECRTTKSIVKKIDYAECPSCGGDIVERKSKRGRFFYGCSNYPQCSFACWDKPTREKCPTCGAFTIEKNDKATGEKKHLCVVCDLGLLNKKENEEAEKPTESPAVKE